MKATKQQQNIVSVSPEAKQYITDCSNTYSAPGKSVDDMKATAGEVVSALIALVEKTRYVSKEVPVMADLMDGEGNFDSLPTGEVETVEVDLFEEELQTLFAARLDAVRTNSATAKLATAEAQLAELRAQLAALTGEA